VPEVREMSASDYSLHKTWQRIRTVVGEWSAIGKLISGLPVIRSFVPPFTQADFTGLMFFEARFVASLRIADHSLSGAALQSFKSFSPIGGT